MINVLKIKGKMTEKGFTQEKLAGLMGIDKSTLNRKLNTADGKSLTVKEAMLLIEILGLENPEEYFFCAEVA